MCVKPQKSVPPLGENHYSIWVFQTGEETLLQASGEGIVEKLRGLPPGAAHVAPRLCENKLLTRN